MGQNGAPVKGACASGSIGPEYNSERDFLKRRNSLVEDGHIHILRNVVGNDSIENRKNLGASATLTQHGDEDLLGHFEEEKCKEQWCF